MQHITHVHLLQVVLTLLNVPTQVTRTSRLLSHNDYDNVHHTDMSYQKLILAVLLHYYVQACTHGVNGKYGITRTCTENKKMTVRNQY